MLLSKKTRPTFKLILVFILGAISFAQADPGQQGFRIRGANPEDCQGVDLRGELPPVKNQGDAGWCYAYALSDVLGHALHIHASATDVALSTIREGKFGLYRAFNMIPVSHENIFGLMQQIFGSKETRAMGGEILSAFEAVKKHGICTEDEFGEKEGILKHLQTIEDLKEKVDSLEFRFQRSLTPHARAVDLACDQYMDSIKQAFPRLSIDPFIDVLITSSGSHVLSNVRDKACLHRKEIDHNLKPRVALIKDPSDSHLPLMNHLWDALDQRKVTGIEFDSAFLFDLNRKPISTQHSVAIAGRRWNPQQGKCEVLIRDNHGPDCGKKDGRNLNPIYECQKGYLWVPATYLIDRTWRVYHF